MLYQLSYEAIHVGRRSIVGSYVPVKEMSVNDIWNKSGFIQASLRNCINCVHCDDHFFIFISFPQFIYDLFSYIINKKYVVCKEFSITMYNTEFLDVYSNT